MGCNAHTMLADEMRADEIHAHGGCMAMRHMPHGMQACTWPIKYTPLRCTPVKYVRHEIHAHKVRACEMHSHEMCAQAHEM
jgi:hypothetical protein